MAFKPPTFNLRCFIWRFGNPHTNPPDVISICNLALGRRSGILLGAGADLHQEQGGMWLLLPKGTDIRDSKAPAGPDTVEVGAGTGRKYVVAWVDDAGGGFPNEHRFAEIVGVASWPVPFPQPSGMINPVGAPYLFQTVDLPFAQIYTSTIFANGFQNSVVSVLTLQSGGALNWQIQDGAGNILTPINSITPGLQQGTFSQLSHFLYQPVQDPDCLIAVVPGSGQLAWAAIPMLTPTHDRNGNASGAGSVTSCPTFLATTQPAEVGVCSVATTTNPVINPAWSAPFTDQGGAFALGLNGPLSTWILYIAWAHGIANGTTPNPQADFTPNGPVDWNALTDTFF